jgi:dTDP-4-amino-4,6-dideoxygalactose transaminase
MALGSSYKESCGTFGDVSVCHLMGSKIITTSGERLLPQKN